MLQAQFLKGVLDWPYSPCLKIGESLADAFHRLGEILPLPFERVGEHLVERCGGVLSTPVSVIVQLRLSFW
jgi:hypothetical protein